MAIKIETVSIQPKYGENGGTGFVEARTPSGRLLNLHVDGSLIDSVVREQVLAVCELAGMTPEESRAEAERASTMTQALLRRQR